MTSWITASYPPAVIIQVSCGYSTDGKQITKSITWHPIVGMTERQSEKKVQRVVKGAPIGVFVMIALYSGLRREDILGLKWDCVELNGDAPHIKVRRALRWNNINQPKVTNELKSNAARRDVPIPPQLATCMKEAKKSSNGDYVISNSNGEPISQTSFKNMWAYISRRSTGTATRHRVDSKSNGELKKQMVTKKLGEQIPKHDIYYEIDFKVTPHILRHTYITELIIGGVDPKTVQYLAGHAKAGLTLDVYTHLMENTPKQLIGKILPVFDKGTP